MVYKHFFPLSFSRHYVKRLPVFPGWQLRMSPTQRYIVKYFVKIFSFIFTPVFLSRELRGQQHHRQGRIKGGQRGQLPRAPRWNGAPRDEIYLFQIKYSVEKFSWFRSDTRTQLYYIPMFCQVWRAPNNNWFLYIRRGEPNYYRGPHELCIIAGGPQNQQILS